MAALSADSVKKVWTRLMQVHISPARTGVQGVRVTKPQVANAVVVTNTWIDANLASYLAALNAGAPEVAADFSAQEKALLFAYTVMEKYGLL